MKSAYHHAITHTDTQHSSQKLFGLHKKYKFHSSIWTWI